MIREQRGVLRTGRSAVWLAHLLWEQGVGSSNLLAPTRVKVLTSGYAGIAQLARAMAFQAVGRGFESRFPLQNEMNYALLAQLDRATAF